MGPVARTRLLLATIALLAGVTFATPVHAADAPVGDGPTADEVTDTTFGWRLENDPSECIGFNPKPNCGYEPQDAGERGGALQITLFFVLMAALGVIGTVIGRNVVRRDRAIAERMREGGPTGTSPGT